MIVSKTWRREYNLLIDWNAIKESVDVELLE